MNNAVGSLWRKWDLHIHTPASYHWDGGTQLRNLSGKARADEISKLIDAINAAPADVFAVMDYWTFDGYIALKEFEAANPGSLKKTVFPGMELRLPADTFRLNAHVLLSNELSTQKLQDFKSRLQLALLNAPLSDERLIECGRAVPEEVLRAKGLQKLDLTDDGNAWKVGCMCSEILADSLTEAFKVIPNGSGVVLMPYDTNDGLSAVKWAENYAYFHRLVRQPHIFETRKLDYKDAFNGKRTGENAAYFAAFQNALQQQPRLAVSGSDAHRYSDYAEFPNGKCTWIKAEPTFEGLRQAIREPVGRSFIGKIPPKLELVSSLPTRFIQSLHLTKAPGSPAGAKWFDGQRLALNHDLIAIIGNKGSGKSALADIVALLGNSHASNHFSFLSPKRFLDPQTRWAERFSGHLTWANGETVSKGLHEGSDREQVERVRYVPQEYFEGLCNEHIEGRTTKFENELKSVIFSHIADEERLGTRTLDELLTKQESELNREIRTLRSALSELNEQIATHESSLSEGNKSYLASALHLKEQEVGEWDKQRPAEVPKPDADSDPALVADIGALDTQLQALSEQRAKAQTERKEVAEKVAAATRALSRLKSVQSQLHTLLGELTQDLSLLGVSAANYVKFEFDEAGIQKLLVEVSERRQHLDEVLNSKAEGSNAAKTEQLNNKKVALQARLDLPARQYAEHLSALAAWESQRQALLGNPSTPETLVYFRDQLEQLKTLPETVHELKRKRLDLSKQIHGKLSTRRELRESMFAPVQKLIDTHALVRDEFRLQFRNHLVLSSFEAEFFTFIKFSSGTFRGESEGRDYLQRLVAKYDVNDSQQALQLATEVLDAVLRDKRTPGEPEINIDRLLRTDRTRTALYDFIFGFNYVEPRYSLLLADTPIEKLSPGQRGALLLIFYLLVDRDTVPIVLDQPEENLDNETIFSLLVPVIKEAKERRQVIMVTHSANLAVVCDAEQIVYASFDRMGAHAVSYTSGAIESSSLNTKVVDVLEGTMKAFENRGGKYLVSP